MNRILSTLIAGAIAITSLGAVAPASAASLVTAAPAAAAQTADNLLVEVKHGGKKGGFKRHGKRFGFKFHYGGHYGYDHCWTHKKVWTKYGWRWQKVYICY